MILPRCWDWLLIPGAKVTSYLGAGIGFCIDAPRHDDTFALALAADSGAPRSHLTLALELASAPVGQGMILPWDWNWLLPWGGKL